MGAGAKTCPSVACADLTYPKVACLGAIVGNLRDRPAAILKTCLEARIASR